tara:strand:+ start:357 stop:725 length:369 start_codon:yes stop_codon:yes gene_type:complete
MKLLKYLLFILILVGSLIFLVELNQLNIIDGKSITIKIPFLIDYVQYENGFNVWIVLVSTLTAGVFIRFFIALFQIVSQKSEIISFRSKLKRLQIELDSLRNQAIDDNIEISDEFIDSEDEE